MKIIALVENETKCELKAKHGLALYIETQFHKILFDVGPDNTLFENAKAKGIDLKLIDTVIISHGHMDHGGALEHFLEINESAKIYVQRKAFETHYSKFLFLKLQIGLDKKLKNYPQVNLMDGDYQIDDELSLFTVKDRKRCYSEANDTLYIKGTKDDFSHEQNLVIKEEQTALIIGCGHTGIVNIMKKAEQYQPTLCVGGYHLFNPATKKTVSAELLMELANELKQYSNVKFYTCHCTGKSAFDFLSQRLPNLFYLSCGDTI